MTRKQMAMIRKLRRKGIRIRSGGPIPPYLARTRTPSLAEVRRILSKIKGNLSDTVAEIRGK